MLFKEAILCKDSKPGSLKQEKTVQTALSVQTTCFSQFVRTFPLFSSKLCNFCRTGFTTYRQNVYSTQQSTVSSEKMLTKGLYLSRPSK